MKGWSAVLRRWPYAAAAVVLGAAVAGGLWVNTAVMQLRTDVVEAQRDTDRAMDRVADLTAAVEGLNEALSGNAFGVSSIESRLDDVEATANEAQSLAECVANLTRLRRTITTQGYFRNETITVMLAPAYVCM